MRIAQGAAFYSATAVCTPGYLNLEGELQKMPAADDHVAMMKMAKLALWPTGVVALTRVFEQWEKDGKLEGIDVTVAA